MSQNIISAEIKSLPKQTNKAALALQSLGFRILRIGETTSIEAPTTLWQSIFNIEFVMSTKNVMPELKISDVTYPKAMTENMTIPPQLEELIAEVVFVEPAELN